MHLALPPVATGYLTRLPAAGKSQCDPQILPQSSDFSEHSRMTQTSRPFTPLTAANQPTPKNRVPGSPCAASAFCRQSQWPRTIRRKAEPPAALGTEPSIECQVHHPAAARQSARFTLRGQRVLPPEPMASDDPVKSRAPRDPGDGAIDRVPGSPSSRCATECQVHLARPARPAARANGLGRPGEKPSPPTLGTEPSIECQVHHPAAARQSARFTLRGQRVLPPEPMASDDPGKSRAPRPWGRSHR
jgi:hypothetical protein